MDIRVPRLGEGADSGTVVNVLVKEGDSVKKDQTLIELENEKAVAPIPSTHDGKIAKIHVKINDKVSVGQVIVSLAGGNGSAPAPAPSGSGADVPRPAVFDAPVRPMPSQSSYPEASRNTGAVVASPSVRKLAQDLGIDLSRVRGTESGGRISLADVRNYVQYLQQLAFQAPPTAAGQTVATPKPPAESIDFSKWGPVRKESMTGLRQAIARKMGESWSAVPRVAQFDDADITAVLALRKKHVEDYKKKGVNLTLTGFVLKALAKSLKKHPKLNASLDEAKQEIVYKEYVHIGIAVDTEQGLIVPVLRDVDKKSVMQISKELQDLADRTRQRKAAADELKGASFTVSNQGGIGGTYFTPIVNTPEVAILGLGKGSPKPVVKGDKIEIRTLMPVSLSYDHRLVDGGDAVRFLNELVAAIENFNEADLK